MLFITTLTTSILPGMLTTCGLMEGEVSVVGVWAVVLVGSCPGTLDALGGFVRSLDVVGDCVVGFEGSSRSVVAAAVDGVWGGNPERKRKSPYLGLARTHTVKHHSDMKAPSGNIITIITLSVHRVKSCDTRL